MTYDPDTGKGYDIEGALIFDNGQYMPGAGYEPTGPAVPLVTNDRPEDKTKAASDKTLLFIIAGGILFLLAMKR